MLPGVKGRLRLVAAALLLTVRLAGAHTSEAPTPGMPQTPHGTPSQAHGQEAQVLATQKPDLPSQEEGVNVITPSDEPRVPMQNPSRGIAVPGDTMVDNDVYHQFLLDRLETVRTRDATGWAWDMQGWFGKDLDRLWLKTEGERLFCQTADAKVEALWGHAFATFWDWQAGVRRDFGGGPTRTWAAFGVQGLAPYSFDVEATLYVSNGGRLAARVRATYDVRLSQRSALTPEIEANVYSKTDQAREIGRGLADVRLGLRLRYELRRDFAPYIGVVWSRKLGRSAEFARAAGQDAVNKQIVAGIRWWF
jgi:copper resistance protein B